MPRFLVELQAAAQAASLEGTLMSVDGVSEVTPTRTFSGLIVTADAQAKQELADRQGVKRVYDDIQAVPQVAVEDVRQDFLSEVRDKQDDEPAPLIETAPTEPRTDGGRVSLPELTQSEQHPANADPRFNSIGGSVELAGAAALHDEGITGNGVIMVVVDTGVCADQFAPSRRLDGTSFVDDSPWSDYLGHGSMDAGIAAGGPQTHAANPGFAPGTLVYPIKSTMTASELIKAQDTILELRERTGKPVVVNNSWGFTQCTGICDHPVTEAIDNAARTDGVYQVFAAGNQGETCGQECTETGVSGPGSLDSVLTVAATGHNGDPQAVMPYSSRGGPEASCGTRKPDVAGPIFGTVPWGCGTRNIGNGGGTSAACPEAAGTVALLLSKAGGTPPSTAVFEDIRSTARSLGGATWDGCRGHGNVSAADAASRTTSGALARSGFDTSTAAVLGSGLAGALLSEYWR